MHTIPKPRKKNVYKLTTTRSLSYSLPPHLRYMKMNGRSFKKVVLWILPCNETLKRFCQLICEHEIHHLFNYFRYTREKKKETER